MSEDKVTIIIRKIHGGWRVERHRVHLGNDKGTESLATTCGGNLGKILALECARVAATIGMADEVVLDTGEGEAQTYKSVAEIAP